MTKFQKETKDKKQKKSGKSKKIDNNKPIDSSNNTSNALNTQNNSFPVSEPSSTLQQVDLAHPISANFLTGPPHISDKLLFKAFRRVHTLPEENDLVIVGQGHVQAYRSIDSEHKTELMGIYDPTTKSIQFSRSISVNISHAEVKSQNYMNRYSGLMEHVAIRKQENMQERYVKLRLEYGDNRSKAKVKESTFGLRPTRLAMREVSSYSNDLYYFIPLSIEHARINETLFYKIFPFSKIFGNYYIQLNSRENMLNHLKNPPKWAIAYKQNFDRGTPNEILRLNLFLAFSHITKRTSRVRKPKMSMILDKEGATEDEIYIIDYVGIEAWKKLFFIKDKKAKYRYYLMVLILGMYISNSILDSYRIENFSQFCEDVSWDSIKGNIIAEANGIQKHPSIADCIYYNESTPFKSVYSAAIPKERKRKVLSTTIH